MKNMSLATQIFIALILAIASGFLLQGNAAIANEYIKPFGTIFLNLLKFIVVPIVLFSIMSGIITLKDIRKVGVIGAKTVIYYLATTFFAIAIGIAGGWLFHDIFPVLSTSDIAYQAKATPSFMSVIVNIFPSNFLAPISSASMLQVIVMALLMGFSIILVGKEDSPAERIIHSFNEVFMKCMELILKLSPYGVFCLLCPVVAVNGPAVIGSLAMVLLAAYLCYAAHMFIVYSLILRIFGVMNPLDFFRGHMPAMIFSFSSASSVGTLPINMSGCRRMGASKEVTSFVLPLGATINMDGTAIYQGVCAIFIASCYGIDLSLGQMATIAATATLASIGTAGVPGAGMVMLAMVLLSVGLPVDGIALVAGVDRIFDMGRTVVNITGDAVCALLVSKSERR
ncbi:MAG: dicarboxylate/amino acid:cation symporter [Desulfovibrionaceae bacterium]|nr:dicarboxylate/amino acid:cation symporter [Desulfovibrionaceae bacterium]